MDEETGAAIVAISQWVDSGNSSLPREALTWTRIGKLAEEVGEVVSAYIGATGQNPRKGWVGSIADVEHELLDVAVTALAALEHLRGHDGQCMRLLMQRAGRTLTRAEAAG